MRFKFAISILVPAYLFIVGCSSDGTTPVELNCLRTSQVCSDNSAMTCQYHAKFKFTDVGITIESDDLAVFGSQPPSYAKSSSMALAGAQALGTPQNQLNDGEVGYDVFTRIDGQTGQQILIGQKLQGDAKKSGIVLVANIPDATRGSEIANGVVYNCHK